MSFFWVDTSGQGATVARRIIRIRADELMAGDTLVVKEGSIRKFYHVCEVAQDGDRIRYVYNVRHGFKHEEAKAGDKLRVREEI